MKKLIKAMWLALVMIFASSAILLFSDLRHRQGKDRTLRKETFPQIAILQLSSTLLLDTHVAGVIDRLQERGFIAPDQHNLHKFNSQGELSMANTIAQEILNTSCRIVITSSTVMMQTFAKVNRDGSKIHVFGAVTDPFGTGVGITGREPADHPPYMAGVGTFQPVQRAFRILMGMNPGIRRVGVVWNSGEQCSDACLREARLVCRELGIDLVEAIATSTTEVLEATRSLLSRGAEAIWIGGDTVAITSAALIIRLARQAGIPVFTNDPLDAEGGALFGLGADYFTVGQYTGDMAADILEGKKTSDIRIENIVPEKLGLNHEVLAWLGKSWSLSDSVNAMLERQNAQKTSGKMDLDFAVLKEKNEQPTTDEIINANVFHNLHLKNGRPARVALINLVENYSLDQAIAGVEAGLKESGMAEGRDFVMKKFSAQGEIGQLPQIIDAVVMGKPDAIITVTTPALIATVRKVSRIPVIFTIASDPVRLGVYKGEKPGNICGVYDNPKMRELLGMAMKFADNPATVGTLFDPGQINSMISVERLRIAGKETGVKILEAPVTAVSEIDMAVRSLAAGGAKALLLSADNLVFTGFPVIHKLAEENHIPVFVTEMELIDQGADGGIGVSYFEWGKQSGIMAAKVLAGVPPEILPSAEINKRVTVEPGKAKPSSQKE